MTGTLAIANKTVEVSLLQDSKSKNQWEYLGIKCTLFSVFSQQRFCIQIIQEIVFRHHTLEYTYHVTSRCFTRKGILGQMTRRKLFNCLTTVGKKITDYFKCIHMILCTERRSSNFCGRTLYFKATIWALFENQLHLISL